jgi:hypothetical protein
MYELEGCHTYTWHDLASTSPDMTQPADNINATTTRQMSILTVTV